MKVNFSANGRPETQPIFRGIPRGYAFSLPGGDACYMRIEDCLSKGGAPANTINLGTGLLYWTQEDRPVFPRSHATVMVNGV